MSLSEYMDFIADKILQHRPVPSGWYDIYVKGGQIKFSARPKTVDPSTHLIRLSSIDVNEGLLSWTWTQLQRKVQEFITEGKLS